MTGLVTAVSRSATHSLSKFNADCIQLLVGLGVEGDAHSGNTVKHRSRLARFADAPNLRQVHLINAVHASYSGRRRSSKSPVCATHAPSPTAFNRD